MAIREDLGRGHVLERTGDGFATVWHQHKYTGHPCGYRIMSGGPGDPRDTAWLRCPACGDLGRIAAGFWDGDDGRIPTVLRDAELMMVLPV